MRISFLVLASAVLLLAACKSNPEPDPTATAEGDATGVATATAADAGATTEGDDTTAATDDDADGDAALVSRYIGNTGGSGVAIRNACQQDARAGGAWPEATGVLVLEVGAGGCDGWSYVARDGSTTESWVRNVYLVDSRPTVTVSRPPSSTPTSPPSSTSTPTTTPPTPAPTPPPVTYPQIAASPNPVSFGEIPPGNTSVLSVLLANSSPGPVTITAVVFANGAHESGVFQVTSNCDGQTVQSGVSCRVVARFTPTAGGQYQGTIYVSTSSATAPLQLTLLGTGYIAD